MSSFTYDNTSRVLETLVGAIHYHEAGDGPALILIHGSGPGVTGWANFEHNLPVFARHFRTFIIDLPGYGGSAPIEGMPMQVSADAVIRFMDALKIDKGQLLEDGQVLSEDVHSGITGAANAGNIYLLKLDKVEAGKKYELAAMIASSGGNDSNGDIWMSRD